MTSTFRPCTITDPSSHLNNMSLAAPVDDLPAGALQVGGIPAGDVDCGAGLAQLQRDSLADAAGGARHEGHAATPAQVRQHGLVLVVVVGVLVGTALT